MPALIQRSFSGGELAPSLHARTDTNKYSTGLRTMRNFYTMRHGGATNRPGGTFVAEVKDSSKAMAFIPFIFNNEQTYVLEFGDGYMRVHQNGVQLTESAKVITAITQANPAVVTIAGHGYTTGDEVYISGVVGMTQVNGYNFKITVLGANTFSLQYLSGSNVNSTAFTAYASGGTSEKVYEIVTPYAEADLHLLQYVQSADVITIVSHFYPPLELTRTGNTSWSLDEIQFTPEVDRPTGLVSQSITAGANNYKWRVTAIDAESDEESLVALGNANNITAATQANPVQITYSGTDYVANGDVIYIEGIVGMTELNGLNFQVKAVNTAANTYTLHDANDGSAIDGTAYGAYVSGGIQYLTYATGPSAAVPTTADPIELLWNPVTGVRKYNVYCDRTGSGVFGYLGSCEATIDSVSSKVKFFDVGLDPDYADTPPAGRNPFAAEGDWPATVTYIQQRLAMANTVNAPEKILLSKSGQFTNFTISSPIQDDDAITFSLAGRQVNEIRHIVDLGGFAILTSGGEWTAAGDSNGIITPTNLNLRQATYNGAATLKPLPINGSCLYLQARGSIVRDLAFDANVEGYRGNDITIFSAHLFEGHTIVDWAFQQTPHSIVWCVRDDGVLIACTYVKDQEMLAWHRHDFSDGFVENVCVVPEGSEDYLYVTVRRTISGRTTRYIERMASRQILDIKDACFMDSSAFYDGRNTNTANTMTLSGGTTWAYDEDLTLTSVGYSFTNANIGNEVHLTGSDGTIIRCVVTARTSATIVTVNPNKTVPVSMRSVATSTWSIAVDEVAGLQHLEGLNVSVFADAFVVASPMNDSYNIHTVSNGRLALDRCYGVIRVGLPYTSDLETLDIDQPQGPSYAAEKKQINKVSMHVEDSRGIFVGTQPPSDDSDDPLEGLVEMKLRSDESPDEPVELKTEVISVSTRGQWNSNGRVFVRQVDPLPLSILSVMPEGSTIG